MRMCNYCTLWNAPHANAVEVVGYDATIGFTQWANKPCTTNAFVRPLLLPFLADAYLPTRSLTYSSATVPFPS